ncbi:MAG: malonyl-CoA decarboxylase N-terminal domain-containing protein, partial [Rhizorhabdus sp.]|uniref:malonyl-CoA decarboxylase N-terminal domain-containing protein n=1 Tax=Rhizorhabdus sp. TaxID=1968843 RepID=UPI001B714EDE|nr:malonyl-CoA decarboxylase N-terminal domain-containing protein [Rhizorhabdus sp.]
MIRMSTVARMMRVEQAAGAYIASPGDAALKALQKAVESPRQEFFRRLNLAPGAT